MRSRTIPGLVFLVLPLAATAQQAAPAGAAAPDTPRHRAPYDAAVRHKSAATAVLASVGATVIGTAVGLGLMSVAVDDESPGFIAQQAASGGALLAGAAVVAGPAAGYLYADEYRQARTGIIVRGVVGVVSSAVIYALILDDMNHLFDPAHEGNDDAIAAVATVGLGTIALSALIDFARLPRVVGEHNRRLGTSRPTSPTRAEVPRPSWLDVAPFYSLRGDVVGLRVVRTF